MKSKIYKIKNIILYALLGIVWIMAVAIGWFRFDHLIDSDMSSELVLSRLLADENRILTPNWYYSTELRVLNTQLIYSAFFRVFHDWTVIRTASVMVMYTILLISIYYFMKQYNCSEYFCVAGIILLLPFSDIYFTTVLCGAYYIPHIVISLLTFAIFQHYVNTGKGWLIMMQGLLALMAGLGGIREIVILYFPLGIMCIAGVIHYWKNICSDRIIKAYVGNGVACVIAAIGFSINKLWLSKIYTFGRWKQVTGTSPISLDRLSDVMESLLECFQMDIIKSPLSTVAGLIWIVATVFLIVTNLRKNSEKMNIRISLYLILEYAVLFAVFMFTNMHLEARYFLMSTIFSVLLLCMSLSSKQVRKMEKIILGLIVGMTIVFEIQLYCKEWNVDPAKDHITIANYLEEEKITSGYATFWNANVLTELSNGKIEVWSWGVPYDDEGRIEMESIDDIYCWLQLKTHKIEKPKGKVFVLLGEKEYESFKWSENLKQIPCSFKIEGAYRLWIFQDYESLKKSLAIMSV